MFNDRQLYILDFIKDQSTVSISDILDYLANGEYANIPRITINRDLVKLTQEKKINKVGKARATSYNYIPSLDEYFERDTDERLPERKSFNFSVWDRIKNIFTKQELDEIDLINSKYLKNKSKLSKKLLEKEFERLTIEFAWKSSKIEGNTYSLLDTERLIKEKEEAAGKKQEESIMILNHKKALDFIFASPKYFEEITLTKIEELHRLLTGGLDVNYGIRRGRVGITGTNYLPLDNEHQIKDVMVKLVKAINKAPIFEKALIAVLMISYIQPFEDGNKRTGRILGNAILLANNYCPLSYRSVNEIEYKKTIIMFYEQNNYYHFKEIFVDQFTQAIEKYF
jgi:Fic family protein